MFTHTLATLIITFSYIQYTNGGLCPISHPWVNVGVFDVLDSDHKKVPNFQFYDVDGDDFDDFVYVQERPLEMQKPDLLWYNFKTDTSSILLAGMPSSTALLAFIDWNADARSDVILWNRNDGAFYVSLATITPNLFGPIAIFTMLPSPLAQLDLVDLELIDIMPIGMGYGGGADIVASFTFVGEPPSTVLFSNGAKQLGSELTVLPFFCEHILRFPASVAPGGVLLVSEELLGCWHRVLPENAERIRVTLFSASFGSVLSTLSLQFEFDGELADPALLACAYSSSMTQPDASGWWWTTSSFFMSDGKQRVFGANIITSNVVVVATFPSMIFLEPPFIVSYDSAQSFLVLFAEVAVYNVDLLGVPTAYKVQSLTDDFAIQAGRQAVVSSNFKELRMLAVHGGANGASLFVQYCAHCDDSTQNEDEEDVDCGGRFCKACGDESMTTTKSVSSAGVALSTTSAYDGTTGTESTSATLNSPLVEGTSTNSFVSTTMFVTDVDGGVDAPPPWIIIGTVGGGVYLLSTTLAIALLCLLRSRRRRRSRARAATTTAAHSRRATSSTPLQVRHHGATSRSRAATARRSRTATITNANVSQYASVQLQRMGGGGGAATFVPSNQYDLAPDLSQYGDVETSRPSPYATGPMASFDREGSEEWGT